MSESICSGHEKNSTDRAEIRGSCLCGSVRYSARGPLTIVGRCHCVWCRKASGAEFATNASVDSSGFEVLEGESKLRSFESSPGQERVFCGECGSPLFKRYTTSPGVIRLRLGCVDTEITERVEAHVFVSRKLALSDSPKDLPAFDEGPVSTRTGS